MARRCGAHEFQLFERRIDRRTTNWATCDGIASRLTAACLADDPALISKLHALDRGEEPVETAAGRGESASRSAQRRHTAEIFALAERLMLDDEEMVQEGSGWLLKESYPPHPRETMAFLLRWKDRAPRLTLRCACEKMPAADRFRVLGR